MIEVRVEISRTDDVVIARIEGELDFSNVATISEQIAETVTNDAVGLAVDLSVIRFMDSAGIRMLFNVFAKLETSRQGAALILGDKSVVRHLVGLTHLDSVAPAFSSVEEAVAHLRESADDRI